MPSVNCKPEFHAITSKVISKINRERERERESQFPTPLYGKCSADEMTNSITAKEGGCERARQRKRRTWTAALKERGRRK